MQNKLLEPFRAERWLYIFITTHLLLWTLVPTLLRRNLPLDAIEGTIWGHQLDWGYDKNPFLNGWLTALATFLGGQSGWMIYFFSQLSVAVCLWVVWRLAKKMLPPTYALIAVMILEGVQYFNFHAIDFNDNTLELGLWALIIYFFYESLRTSKTRYWMLTGIFAGHGMMAKYYTETLLATQFLLLVLNPANRKQFATRGPYLSLALFLLIIAPHVIWLFSHDFITVAYVFKRAGTAPSWTNHFFFPAQFAWQQFEAFLPAIVLLCLLFIGKKPFFETPKTQLSSFDKQFLVFVGLGPFLVTVLLSFSFGIKLRAGWGMPLLSLWGLILVASVQPALTKLKMNGFVTIIFVLISVLLSGYTVSIINSSTATSANFPGREIARLITHEWHNTYHTKLSYIAGSRWVGGNIGFYSSDHPAVFVEWDKRRAPWVDVADMQEKGAVFVWETPKEKMPVEIRQRFPQLKETTYLELSWHRNTKNLPPVKIGVAILPPKQIASPAPQKP
jgi:4-amino-4-deoxy-L-arabinose transferase-like glycosyltransferase